MSTIRYYVTRWNLHELVCHILQYQKADTRLRCNGHVSSQRLVHFCRTFRAGRVL